MRLFTGLTVYAQQALSGYRTAIINSYEEEGGARGYVEKMLNQGKAPNENPSFVSVVSAALDSSNSVPL